MKWESQDNRKTSLNKSYYYHLQIIFNFYWSITYLETIFKKSITNDC